MVARQLKIVSQIGEFMISATRNIQLLRTYEGGSIFNGNSPLYPSFIFTHFIITFIKRSVSWLNECKIAVVELLT